MQGTSQLVPEYGFVPWQVSGATEPPPPGEPGLCEPGAGVVEADTVHTRRPPMTWHSSDGAAGDRTEKATEQPDADDRHQGTYQCRDEASAAPCPRPRRAGNHGAHVRLESAVHELTPQWFL